MKWIEIDSQLAGSGLSIFSDREFRQITGVSQVAAKFLLIRYAKRGLLCRLKRGLYAARARMPSSWAIANRVYKPSYVSLESALSHYGLIPESVYGVTSVTTRATREFEIGGSSFLYRTIKRAAFAGYRAVEMDGQSILLAEKEKALADYLYLAFLRKERVNSRLAIGRASKTKLRGYLRLFESRGLLRWVSHDLKIPDSRTAY